MSGGDLCISIDLELAWGNWDCLTPEYVQCCLNLERAIVRRLLSIFERYEIATTWAIVGHLLDEQDACSEMEKPAWYAPDLISMINTCSTRQEIGSHGYAHIYFTDCSRDQAERDLESAQMVHDRCGLEFNSFVFPRNLLGHMDLVAHAGVKVFRGKDLGWQASAEKTNKQLGRIANLFDKMVPICPTVVRPIHHRTGLVELPSSMLLMGRNGVRKLIQPDTMKYKGKLGLEAAVREQAVFHLWFHPSNFFWDPETQFSILESIVRTAATMRDKGLLAIQPMGAYAGNGRIG